MDLYFDCSSGISGDMTLGALVDLGANLDGIIRDLGKMPVTGFHLTRQNVMQCGTRATRIGVEIREEDDDHRSLDEVRDILLAAHLPARAEKRALDAFKKLAVAEAKVHGTTIEKIHFHEVGALDAIVDVAGSMLALEQLGATRIFCSALNVGHGTIQFHHGVFPVPAPATAELLKGIPCYQDELTGELVTPTGAAILAATVESFGLMPAFAIEKIGYGAGTREHAIPRPNFLRVCGGSLLKAAARPGAGFEGLEHERLCQISTEMDDESGETFTALFDRLFEMGALDVNLLPVQMKKNRPGVSLHVLCATEKAAALAEAILRDTSTFGLKIAEVDRYCLPRRIETIETRYGAVAVKVGEWSGHLRKAKPEFDCCRRLAQEKGVTVKEIILHANERIAGMLAGGERRTAGTTRTARTSRTKSPRK